MLHKLSFMLVLLLTFTLADAQSEKSLSSQQVIQVRADTLEIDFPRAQAVYTGNVKIVQDSFRLTADQVTIFFENQQPTRLEATGNPLRFQQQTTEGLWQGQAKHLSYRLNTGLLTLEGNAELSQGKNQMRSQSLRYNLNQSRLTASGSGGIEMLLYPNTSQIKP